MFVDKRSLHTHHLVTVAYNYPVDNKEDKWERERERERESMGDADKEELKEKEE